MNTKEFIKENWINSCDQFANLHISLTHEIQGNPFFTPEQQKQREINHISKLYQNHEIISLLQTAIKQLNKDPDPHAQLFIQELSASLNDFEYPDLSELSEEWKGIIEHFNIETEVWNWVKTKAEYLLLHDIKEASPLFALIALCEASQSRAWFNLGFSLYQEKEYSLARDALEAAHFLLPQQPEFSLLLGITYASLDEKESAKHLLNAAQESIEQYHLDLSLGWKTVLNDLMQEVERSKT